MMDKFSVIGQSVPRLESEEKVTGRLKYLEDLKLAGLLQAKILRSPHAHATIRQIDARQAAQLPGVAAVLTRDDVLNNPAYDSHYGPIYKDQTIVALDKVRYVGDPVAAVAATRADIAEEALELIEVDYDELPAVFDPEEALAKTAPVLHEKVEMRQHGFADVGGIRPVDGTNICNHFHLSLGDVEKGFRESDHVFENFFSSPAAQHSALEPHMAIASWDGPGRLTIWATVQNPFVNRDLLSEIFHLPLSKIRVISLNIGGGYGSKLYPKLEPVVAALSLKAKRPVAITLTREEVFQTITKHGAKIYLKTGVRKDGRILARQCRIYLDTGAYAEIGPRVSKKSGYTAAGPYDIPNVLVDSYLAYTNKVPAGAFRGFGVTQSNWAHESEMDIIARALQMDPLELRRKNLLREGGIGVTGEHLHGVAIRECLDKVAEAIGWGKPAAPSSPRMARGKGLACLIKATVTPSVSTALIRLNEDGSATVYVGTADVGQGSDTVMAQIVSEELRIPMDQVQILHSDTDYTPYDLSTSSSRSTFHMGRAVQLAAEDIRRQLACLAAPLFRVGPEEIVFENQEVRPRDGGEGLSYRDLFMKHYGIKGINLYGRGLLKTDAKQKSGEPQTSVFWTTGAAAAEVEVDRETGQVRVVRYATAADVGKALNPFFCEQQLRGAAISGIGQALMEQLVYQDGLLINPNFLDYNLPRFLDIPEEIIPILVELPHPDGPFGAKGLGETALIPAPPAIANAVEDAVGARIKDLPITPEKVFLAMQRKREEEVAQVHLAKS
jgi:CO/xanthine dehydrogenase Mo-binding subunit